jgi:hypothetical protein
MLQSAVVKDFFNHHQRGGIMIAENLLSFKLEISNEKMTAHSGLILAHEFHLGLKLDELLNSYLPKAGSGRGYKPSEFVMPIILTLQGGGRDINDIEVIARDKALREAAGIERVPAQSTIGDRLRRTGASKKAMDGLSRVNNEITRTMILFGKRSDFTLDVDTTIIEADKGDGTMAYEGTVGYQPIMGFLYENRWLVNEEFRKGNESPRSGILKFVKKCRSRMPEGTQFARFRSDSAAYNVEVTDYCEDKKIEYTITAEWDAAVKEAYENLPRDAWKRFIAASSHRLREVAQTVHSFNKGKSAFRLIFVRDIKPQKDLFVSQVHTHALITNIAQEKKDAASVVEWHNQRGTMENFIKELKCGVGMRHMPCREFEANACWFRIGALAYNLFLMSQEFGLPPELQSATIETIRWRFYQVAGRLVKHARRLILRVATDAVTFAAMLSLRKAACKFAFG